LRISSQRNWQVLPKEGDLPTPRYGLRALSINNKIIVTGGLNYDGYYSDVLELEDKADSFQWKPIGQMKKERAYHSMSLLALDKVKCVDDNE